MQILSLSPYTICVNRNQNSKLNFGSAKDISLEYVLKNHSKHLPQRVLKKAKELVSSGKNDLPQLFELHEEVYKPLFEAKALEEVKIMYPEFSGIKDITTLKENRSKAIKTVTKKIPLEDFTLEYLKKLYRPTGQDALVSEYGFTNRSLLGWLNKKLNIKKLSGTYIKLVQMSDEKENSRIADLSRKALTADPKVQQYRLMRAAEAHRTPEYREKKRQEMIDFYKRNPEKAQMVGIISQRTWDKCPEIKQAFSDYTKTLSPLIRKVLSKKLAGMPLSPSECRIAYGYYRGFWENHGELKEIYKARRIEVISELQ